MIRAILYGVLAFVITYALLYIVAAILNVGPTGAAAVAAAIDRLAWIFALVAGIIVGLNHYDGRVV